MVADPGPMARFESVKADPDSPSVIFQRMTADAPETLAQIAKAWKVPKGRFVEWFTTVHAALYDAALKVRAADLAFGAMQDALDATPETVSVARLRSDVALKLAAKFDRARFGETVRVEKEVSVLVDAGLLGSAAELLRLMTDKGRVIEHESVKLPAESEII